MTVTHDEATAAMKARTDLIEGLRDLAAWLATHPGSPVPVVHANFRIPAGTPQEKAGYLQDLAAWLGTDVVPDAMGTQIAQRQFGPVLAEGHVSHPDRSVSGYLARAAARDAAQAESGAAA